MSLLSDLRLVFGKYINNPILIGALAYFAYRFITKYQKKEMMAESMKVLKVQGTKSLFYDDKVKQYILLDAATQDVYSSDKPEGLQKLMEK
jgi:hypothetical protein